jgi:hypothetical protein
MSQKKTVHTRERNWEVHRACGKRWVAANPDKSKAIHERYRIKHKAKILARKERMREIIRSLKSRPCTDCHIQYHFSAMQFDHVRGEKKFEVSHGDTRLLQAVMEEASKCEVVCANCHAVRTWKRSNVAKSLCA